MAFAGDAAGARERSPQWREGKFHNPEPIVNDFWKVAKRSIERQASVKRPDSIPRVAVDPALLRTAPHSGLRLTWFGHSSSLVEIDGVRILIDPVWGRRVSPFSWTGPERWFEPLVSLDSLPPLDVVLISHNHYDHLDRVAIDTLEARKPRYVVPLGVGELLRKWGVDSARVVELDWWDIVRVGEVEIVSTPARHASGRGLLDRDKSLWNGYALRGPAHKVWYSGDTGPQKAFAEIGERLGPFDLTLVECGQYDRAWPDWHMSPEQSLAAHKAVRGAIMVPVHWGLFKLAFHGWNESVERAIAANADGAATILVPKPGETMEPATYATVAWWKAP